MGNSDKLCFNINEIFEAPQGEGYNIGKLCNFIRFASCNLSCSWCDTDFSKFEKYSLNDILKKLNPKNSNIILTGGEPLIQPMLNELILFFLQEEKRIFIETNGTMEFSFSRDKRVWVACSPKPESNYEINRGLICSELKYVIDKEITKEDIIKNIHTAEYIWLQPQAGWDGSIEKCNLFLKELSEEYSYSKVDIRLGLQAHKYWGCK
jgi:organic radical activating enzyme